MTRRLFVGMVREEWRLHAELFGDRFAVFPLATALLAGLGFWLLDVAGTGDAAVAAGVHGLAFFFGLQVGTVGLIGRDAIRNTLGEVTMLVFTARTLPVTQRYLLAVFLVKDLLYYSVFFVGPVAVGYAAVALAGGVAPGGVGLLWVTATATFGFGAGASLTLSGLGTRNRWVVVALVGALAAAVVSGRVDLLAFTPLAFYEAPAVSTAVAGFAPAVVVCVAGPLLFEPAESGRARTAADRYARVRDLVGVTGNLAGAMGGLAGATGGRRRGRDGVATRSLLEVAGSSGSVWKVLFSMGVMFGVTVAVVVEVGRATALDPSLGIAVGALLGLGAFTTYSWVTMYDSVAEYRRYPVSMAAVLAGKRRAYLLLVVPAGLVYLLASLYWAPVREVAVGAVVFPLVAVYVFGVTAYVAGLSPNELLFDTALFLVFGAALGVVSVPLVVAALAATAAPTVASGVAVGVAAASAGAGLVLARRAGPRWDDRSRAD